MNICVFQGTFNPIHKVHLKVAKFALDYFKFDKIIFIPAYIPPHKSVNTALAEHRYNMVKIAIAGCDKFDISDIEYKREGKSYTYLTILELKKQLGFQNKINFLIGTDAFLKIDTWYETDKLKELLHFIVFPRCKEFNPNEFDKFKKVGYEFEFAPMDYIDVSSTEIRDNINNGISVADLGIPAVVEYIKENRLYE